MLCDGYFLLQLLHNQINQRLAGIIGIGQCAITMVKPEAVLMIRMIAEMQSVFFHQVNHICSPLQTALIIFKTMNAYYAAICMHKCGAGR